MRRGPAIKFEFKGKHYTLPEDKYFARLPDGMILEVHSGGKTFICEGGITGMSKEYTADVIPEN